MNITGDIPAWLNKAIHLSCRTLGVNGDWHVYAKQADSPGGDGKNNGSCQVDNVYLTAHLEFARDLPDDSTGQQVVLHEVGHIALAEMDWIVHYILENLLDETQRETFRQMYNDTEERFLQRLTRAISEAANVD